MAFEAMSDGMMGGGNWQKLLEDQLKKQFNEGASGKSAQISAQSTQGDSPQVAMQKAVVSKQMQKQQQSSQNNMPATSGGGGGNSMARGGGGSNQLGSDYQEREKTDIMGSGMNAFQQSGGNPYAAAAAVVMAGLEETQAIRQERKEIEKKGKEEEAKGLQNVGDIWTSLAGQMKGLLR